jgi:hypothetical protein
LRDDKTKRRTPARLAESTMPSPISASPGKKSRRYIEDGINALQRRIEARYVTQITYRDLCRATFPRRFASPCIPNQPANLYASLCKRGDHETGEFASRADSEDRRGRTYRDFSLSRLIG